ncbi:O-antigen ligase family protein [Rheinheimera tangshanensis]|uniref:O-antigen ligase family protein n=1 Tax=Rheinheimera tangshanensis TaxID=400153 RepID=A0A5C8LUZ9_9GAMM|nr:O-antigen ligase family protein [Rheinheimera tangshanensis]TXK80557.1 O-antigen ligase family protein [Rheinheimera tangshanensis]GGM60333.1 exopolysaccharide biosynthesis protein [Rheinheimera tangshanensis]
MILSKRAFDVNNVASLILALIVAFSFIGLSPFSVMDNDVRALDETGASNLLRQIIYLLFFIVSVFFYKNHVKVGDFKQSMPLVLMLSWCLLSVLWADHSLISLRRVGLLFIITSSIFMLVSVLSFNQVIASISNIMVIMIITSLISIPIIDGAVHSGTELLDSGLIGSWKGIFIHKNHAGPALVFSISLFIFNFNRTNRFRWLVMIVLSLVFLIFTKSKTSIVLLLPCLLFGYLMYKSNDNPGSKRFITILFFLILTSFVLSIPLLLDFFVELLDNPEAFTGRSTIWNMVYLLIKDHFWFGVGYGSIWSVGEDMRLVDYAIGWVDWVFTLTHAHNGYLEIFASTGFVGFLLSVLVFVVLPFLNGLSIRFHAPKFIFLYFSIYLFFVLHNLVEVDYLNPADGRWLLILIMHFCLYIKNEREFD